MSASCSHYLNPVTFVVLLLQVFVEAMAHDVGASAAAVDMVVAANMPTGSTGGSGVLGRTSVPEALDLWDTLACGCCLACHSSLGGWVRAP